MREELCVIPQRAELVAFWPAFLDAVRGRVGHAIRAKPPHKHADARNIAAAGATVRIDAPHINGVRELVERPIEQVERAGVSDIDCSTAQKPELVDWLRHAEQLIKLDRARRPAGHVVREHFEQRERPFTPSRCDRVRDLAPGNQYLVERAAFGGAHIAWFAGFVHKLVADQVADVRHHPIFAGLNEPILVKLRDVVLDHVHLLADHAQQRAQRIALVRVARAINNGQQVVKAVGIFHRGTSVSTRVCGTSRESVAS